jgi:transcriptional regulator with XRE-family HTH domain
MLQQDVARAAGLAVPVLNRLEHGKAAWHVTHLLRVAAALDTPPEWLLAVVHVTP